MIKNTLPFILVFICLSCTLAQKKDSVSTKNGRDSLFDYHFKILDSVVNANTTDTIYYCCTQQIAFMEEKTKIESKSDGTLLGKLSFSKRDWDEWHKWYKEHYQNN